MWIDLLAVGPQEKVTFTARLSEAVDSARVQIPVAITGRWVHPATQRKIVITASDLQTAKENFRKKANGEINVDYDHASDMPNFVGGARPSAGRVVSLSGPEPYTDSRGTRRKILWGSYEATDMARGMIRKREYRYISPVLQRERVDKGTGLGQGMTITTIALPTPQCWKKCHRFSLQRRVKCCDAETLNGRNGHSRVDRQGAQNAMEELTRWAKELEKKDGLGFEDAFRKVVKEIPSFTAKRRKPSRWRALPITGRSQR